MDDLAKKAYNKGVLSKQSLMGHKHTHFLAAAFSFLAFAQLAMVMDFQKQTNALHEAATMSELNASIMEVRHTDRAERKLLRVDMENVDIVRGTRVPKVLKSAAKRAAERK